MTRWNNYHIYYTNINELILSCLEPFFSLQKWEGMQYFWERHYVGGAHLRLRFTASSECLSKFDAGLVCHVHNFQRAHPSAPVRTYSAAKCRQMLLLDGEDPSPDQYRYRVNEICPMPYQRLTHALPSETTVSIIEDFLQDVRPLAVWTISQPNAVRLNVLRLYFWTALLLCREFPSGSVSYKSHWSGFAASCRHRALIDRIRHSYDDHKEQLAEIMCQVRARYRETTIALPDDLAEWQSLINKYTLRVNVEIRKGVELTPRMKSVVDVRLGREWVSRNTVEESDFLNLLYRNDVNLLLLGENHGMMVARVLTNLLYLYVPLVGMNFLDKMCLCYYAYRTVEDYFQCNLTDIANDTLTRLRTQNEITVGDAGSR